MRKLGSYMRFTRDWGGSRAPLHCCLLDLECWRDYREFHMPMRLYLHCLRDRRGRAPMISLWGETRFRRHFETLMRDSEIANTEELPG